MLGNREIWFRSADNPDSLRSEGIDVLWVDEGGQIKEEAWNLALRPALMDKKGIGIFTGTPKGKNWYFQLWTRGQDKEQPDYQSWSFSSLTNPYIDPAEVEDLSKASVIIQANLILGPYSGVINRLFQPRTPSPAA